MKDFDFDDPIPIPVPIIIDKERFLKIQKILSDSVYTGVYEFGGRVAQNGLPYSEKEIEK